jgi:hypothetical protein
LKNYITILDDTNQNLKQTIETLENNQQLYKYQIKLLTEKLKHTGEKDKERKENLTHLIKFNGSVPIEYSFVEHLFPLLQRKFIKFFDLS